MTAPSGDHPETIEGEGLDLVGILSSINETAYVWHLDSDRIDWESNAAAVLSIDDPVALDSAISFHDLMTAEDAKRRMDAIRDASMQGSDGTTAYRLRYEFFPKGQHRDTRLVVEDQGRWWPGTTGRPKTARGVMRVIPSDENPDTSEFEARPGIDALTGAANRARFIESVTSAIARSERSGISDSLTVLSINNLAVINETFGFEVGDQVVQAVCQRLERKLRTGDVIGRYASNRICILLHGCGKGAMRIAAERFLRSVRDETIATSAGHLAVTASMGGVTMPDQAGTAEDAISFALNARDRARTKKFDCFIQHEPNADHDRVRARSRGIADEILTALDEQRMRLVLQPMVNAKTGRSDIYECLLRMERGDGSLVSAGEFIGVAEQLGLSRLIDRRTLELAVAMMKKRKDLVLSINVSGLTCSDREWLMTLQRLTGRRRDILSRMIIEITETAAIEDLDQSINFVDTLKEMGARVAIDDFGAGYTSFKNLRMMNVDMVKIDGVFIKNVVNDTSDQIFVKTMIHLAQMLGLETVAEWVGDEACAEYLRGIGVDYLQGFHYGMPIDSSELPVPDADAHDETAPE